MRISITFVLFALSVNFEDACAWWATAARGIEPVILSFGTAFAALNLKNQPKHDRQLSDIEKKFMEKLEKFQKENSEKESEI